MMTTGERLTSGLTRAWNWLRGSFAGLQIIRWQVRSYAPIILGIAFGSGLALMPLMFGLQFWTYLLTLPVGVAGGIVAYAAVILTMGDE